MTYNTEENETYCDFCEIVLKAGTTIIVCDEAVGGIKSEDCYGMHLCDEDCWKNHVREVHADHSSLVLGENGETNRHN